MPASGGGRRAALCVAVARGVFLLHILFSLVALFGAAGLLVRREWAWVHLPIVLWAGAINLSGRTCPLTPLENALLRAGGRPAYGEGFLVTYLARRAGFRGTARGFEVAVGLAVLAFNLLAYLLILGAAG